MLISFLLKLYQLKNLYLNFEYEIYCIKLYTFKKSSNFKKLKFFCVSKSIGKKDSNPIYLIFLKKSKKYFSLNKYVARRHGKRIIGPQAYRISGA